MLMAKSMADETSERIILFDGVCNLCNGAVQFILDRDPHAVFRFAALQSDAAGALLRDRGVVVDRVEPDSVILVEGNEVYHRSDAALRVARHLRAPWPAAYALRVVPRFVRDAIYRFIARHRYLWFGRTETCRVPTPELRARFLA